MQFVCKITCLEKGQKKSPSLRNVYNSTLEIIGKYTVGNNLIWTVTWTNMPFPFCDFSDYEEDVLVTPS